MLKRLLCLACAGAIGIVGCTAPGGARLGSAELGQDVIGAKSRQPDRASKAVYLVLAAEIAGQRGQYEEALNNYLEASKLTGDASIAERATQIALYMKNTEKAMEAAQLWAERDSQNISARRISAMLLLKSGQTEQGLKQFDQLLRLPKVDLENTLIELVRWLDTEVPKEDGMKVFQHLLQGFPRMAELHFAYALFASNKGEQRLALGEAEKALQLHRDWSRAQLLRAQVMSQMGDSDAARQAIQKALQNEPNNSRLRLIYAQFLAKGGNFKGAERELGKILDKEADNHDARFALATVLMESGRLEQAHREFSSLTNVPKWQAQASFYLGLMEVKANHIERAVHWFDKIDSGPLEFDARVNAITALINLGRLEEARGRLSEVRQSFPKEALKLYLLEAELLSKTKNYKSAFDLLTEGLDKLPGQTELLYSRALVAEQLNRMDVLEADLRAILEKNSSDPNALNALGYALADRGDRLEEAKKYLEKALELKPDDPAILDSVGWLNYRLRNFDAALDYLRRAYGRVQDPEIGAHLGEVLWESGKKQEAARIWREALRKDPDQEDIKGIKVRYREAFQ